MWGASGRVHLATRLRPCTAGLDRIP